MGVEASKAGLFVFYRVMAGLAPTKDVDARDKRGHDGNG